MYHSYLLAFSSKLLELIYFNNLYSLITNIKWLQQLKILKTRQICTTSLTNTL